MVQVPVGLKQPTFKTGEYVFVKFYSDRFEDTPTNTNQPINDIGVILDRREQEDYIVYVICTLRLGRKRFVKREFRKLKTKQEKTRALKLRILGELQCIK